MARTVDFTTTSATQYATVYGDDERPVATLRRRHSFDPEGTKAWTAYDLNGDLIFATNMGERTLRRRLTDFVNRTGAFADLPMSFADFEALAVEELKAAYERDGDSMATPEEFASIMSDPMAMAMELVGDELIARTCCKAVYHGKIRWADDNEVARAKRRLVEAAGYRAEREARKAAQAEKPLYDPALVAMFKRATQAPELHTASKALDLIEAAWALAQQDTGLAQGTTRAAWLAWADTALRNRQAA